MAKNQFGTTVVEDGADFRTRRMPIQHDETGTDIATGFGDGEIANVIAHQDRNDPIGTDAVAL